MKRAVSVALGVCALLAGGTAAQATVFFPGSPNFTVTGNIASGPVAAYIGNTGLAAGDFSDSFQFRIDQNGLGSGSLSTSTSLAASATDVDIISVVVNGLTAAKTISTDGLSEFFNLSNVPITSGTLNTITITGTARGNGSYGGNVTFTPTAAVPEAATWAMMVIGFGAVGAGLRSRRTSVKFA